MDTQKPVSIKKAKDGIGESGCWNFALRVNRLQHRGPPGTVMRTGDGASFFRRNNLEDSVSLKYHKRRDILIFW